MRYSATWTHISENVLDTDFITGANFLFFKKASSPVVILSMEKIVVVNMIKLINELKLASGLNIFPETVSRN